MGAFKNHQLCVFAAFRHMTFNRSPNDESFGVGVKRVCVVCFNFVFFKPYFRFKGSPMRVFFVSAKTRLDEDFP